MIEKLSPQRKNEVIQRDKKCKNCGSTENLTVDHIVPVSKGGTNMMVNLQTLCNDCNARKGNQIQWSLWKKIEYALHIENLLTNLKNELKGITTMNLIITRAEIQSAKQQTRDELQKQINGQAQTITFLSKKLAALEARSKIKWVEETTTFEGYKKV